MQLIGLKTGKRWKWRIWREEDGASFADLEGFGQHFITSVGGEQGLKGKRREIRRMLAKRSQVLLSRYRRGEAVGEECPLGKALAKAG